MKSPRKCWSILLFLGSSHVLLIDIPQDSVTGTVGHSVLLPISYKLQELFPLPLSIQWTFNNSRNPFFIQTVTNCSVSAEGIPTRCSGQNFALPAYQGRTVFFLENASLLLQTLQLNDSGVYSVTFGIPRQTRNITLTVYELHSNRGKAEKGDETHPSLDLLLGLQITGGFGFILLCLLLVFYGRWRKGADQPTRTDTTKQPEVPNHEESPMDRSFPRTISTIYATIGGDTWDRSTPEQHRRQTLSL